MLNGLGIKTGVDLDLLIDAGNYISEILGRPSGSRVARARAMTSPPLTGGGKDCKLKGAATHDGI
jgi:hypothetical protein